MTQKTIYRLHRILSTVIGVPILLWAVSGLLHPLMTSVRPAIATQASPDTVIPPAMLRKAVPLKTVLTNAAIDKARQIRLIHMDGSWYYQVQTAVKTKPRYFNMQSGQEKPRGDELYAARLARHFLKGDSGSSNIPVQSIQRITSYTDQYSYVNRLLPVYRVSFRRADGIEIYVDTNNSRFAFALDRHRAAFNRFFGWFHTWSWMSQLPGLKAAIIAILLLLALITAGLGIYLSVTTRSKRHKTNPLIKARRLHRLTAVIGAFFLLAWAFSGLVHALQNGRPPFRIRPVTPEKVTTGDLPANLTAKLAELAGLHPIAGIGLFQLEGTLWLKTEPYTRQAKTKDLMLRRQVSGDRQADYYAVKNTDYLHYCERQIAIKMATATLQSLPEASPAAARFNAQYLTHFSEAYNFSDKILPVWQISYGPGIDKTIFLDLNAGTLVKKADPFKQADALIFAFFHKHEFMSWAGKGAKDTSTVAGILIVLTLLIVGYRLLYIKIRQQRKKSKNRFRP